MLRLVNLRELGARVHLYAASGDDLGFCHPPRPVGSGDLAAIGGATFRVVGAIDDLDHGDARRRRGDSMRGDGHTAYGNGSPDCIDPAIENYVNTLTLPAQGTSCQQNIPFAQPQQVQPQALAPLVRQRLQLHTRPIVG
jgi:hypothetical protein